MPISDWQSVLAAGLMVGSKSRSQVIVPYLHWTVVVGKVDGMHSTLSHSDLRKTLYCTARLWKDLG